MAGNHYKLKHFNNKNLKANVTNDTSKKLVTMDFEKDFANVAREIKSLRTQINNALKDVESDINAIKKDKDTGVVIKDALTSHYNSFHNARVNFLSATKTLYNKAITTYNKRLQEFNERMNASETTKVGTSTNVQQEALDDN